MHLDCPRNNVVLSVDDMDSVACLDTMDPALTKSYASQVNTMDSLQVSCTDLEKYKQQIGLKFGCVPLSPIITYSGPVFNGKMFQMFLKPIILLKPVASQVVWAEEFMFRVV